MKIEQVTNCLKKENLLDENEIYVICISEKYNRGCCWKVSKV